MEIIVVTGAVCSGKSTYVKKHFSTDKYVVVQTGRILRDTIGMAQVHKDSGNIAPEGVEFFVRSVVRGAVFYAVQEGRDLVLEGFPRSSKQVEILHRWISEASVLSAIGNTVSMQLRFLIAPKHVLLDRAVKRDPSFDLPRLDDSIRVAELVNQQLMEQFVGFKCAARFVRTDEEETVNDAG